MLIKKLICQLSCEDFVYIMSCPPTSPKYIHLSRQCSRMLLWMGQKARAVFLSPCGQAMVSPELSPTGPHVCELSMLSVAPQAGFTSVQGQGNHMSWTCWAHLPSEPCTHGSLGGLSCIQVEPGFMSCHRDVEGLAFLLVPAPLCLHV